MGLLFRRLFGQAVGGSQRHWNAYFWPKIIAKNEVRRVLTVGLAQLKNTFAGQAVSNYHEIMAGAVLAIIPVVILFLIFQKYMMTGYSKAAMK